MSHISNNYVIEIIDNESDDNEVIVIEESKRYFLLVFVI